MPQATEIILLLVVGLGAGILGGLLGIGGSIVIIPVLTLLLGRDQQLAQATAMLVNVFVAGPAVWRHARARAIPAPVVVRMVPVAVLTILLGVYASNHMTGAWLERVFGIFLVYVVYANLRKLMRPPPNGHQPIEPRTTFLAAGAVGAVMGFSAGLLGIGGGVITVPLLQRVCRLPLRMCIATSATVMCISAPIGAVRKNLALPDLDPAFEISESLIPAACLIPTAIVGGLLGAGLTHALPLRHVRIVFIVLVSIAAMKYLIP